MEKIGPIPSILDVYFGDKMIMLLSMWTSYTTYHTNNATATQTHYANNG